MYCGIYVDLSSFGVCLSCVFIHLIKQLCLNWWSQIIYHRKQQQYLLSSLFFVLSHFPRQVSEHLVWPHLASMLPPRDFKNQERDSNCNGLWEKVQMFHSRFSLVIAYVTDVLEFMVERGLLVTNTVINRDEHKYSGSRK